jgi:spore maturation protein CgeB
VTALRMLMVHPGPDFSVHDVLAGWHEAFQELGVDARVYNLNDRLLAHASYLHPARNTDGSIVRDEQGLPVVKRVYTDEQAGQLAVDGLYGALYTYAPHVVFLVSAFFTREETFKLLRARGHKIVILGTESPYQENEQLLRAQYADLNLINDPANISLYERLDAPVYYQHHCYRPSVHYPRTGPRNPELASDFCFIGTAFDSRIKFFEQLDFGGIDAVLAGNYWGKLPPESPVAKYVGIELGSDADCVSNTEAAELYRNAKVSLNLYRTESEEAHANDIAYAMGPREVEMSACLLPFIRDPRAEGDEILHMLPRFTSPEEATEQMRWLLRHDREREAMAAQAREAVADRTFTASAKRLLKRLEDL